MANNVIANNVTIPATGSGTATPVVATEDITSVHYQLVKLVDGTALGTGRIGGDAANGLDVDVTRLPALVAGTANIGDVDVLTIAAGDNNIGNVDVVTLPALVTGSATIGAVTGPTADNAANPTLKLGVLPAVALAAAPTRTEGNVNPLRVTLAGDAVVTLDGEAVVLGAGTAEIGKLAAGVAVIGALSANQSTNTAQINGVAPTMGNGISGTGVQRVTIASDSTGQVALAAGAATIGALTANQSVNESQINGVTPLMGNGITGTGSQRVTIASDNTVLPGVGAGATGAAVPANASYVGLLAQTALPAAATAGNTVGSLGDKFGRQAIVLGTVRDLRATQTTTISATTETTIVTAGAAGVFNDLIGLIVSNTSVTDVRVDFRDVTAGAVIFSLLCPSNQPAGFAIPGASIPQTTAASAWTAQLAAAVTDIRVFALYEKNK